MDPVIAQRLMDEGRLPNLARMAASGGFQALGTVNPPQSPVAWSSFVTGLDPGGHGIFDFIHRDPATYQPIASATPPPGDPPTVLEIGGLYLPLGGDAVTNNRGGAPFWDVLHEAGVDVEVFRIPGNYPPPASDAKVLAGMGTVDMRGGYGIYTLFTDSPTKKTHPKGDIQPVTVEDYDLDGRPDNVRGTLKGPPDVLRLPPGTVPGDDDYLTAPVQFWLDPDSDTVLIEVGGHRALVAAGGWSDWMTMTFDGLPWGLLSFQGMTRFYVQSVRPKFSIYASPVNIVPSDPAQPLTTPDDWSADLAEVLGPFYTQGMPEETNALNDGTFSDDEYVRQVGLVQADTQRMLDAALDRFAPGDMTFVYVSDVDLQCHMLWRHGDPKTPGAPPHPAHDPVTAPAHRGDIEGFYEDVDRTVGAVLERLPDGSRLLVMSDHGFQPWTRQVHLNTWLRDQGWLALKDGKQTGQITTGDVDWSRTKAYGLGFNAIYLNVAGREAQGIVPPADADALALEIRTRLLAATDPADGRAIVRNVHRTADIYAADRRAEGPDLVVGYDAGYGASDASTLGEVVPDWISDNRAKWSGNHLMDATVVPGVLFSNRPMKSGPHDLLDVTATVLAAFGVSPAAGMTGTSVLAD
jgi:predicted AlkP superfamily phosphohydrolase/phosphomutase